MAGPAILLEIITYIFQCTPPTCECDEPLMHKISVGDWQLKNSAKSLKQFIAQVNAAHKTAT